VATIVGPSSARAAGITDMTELARQFPRHSGSTVLWVNFDGWRNYEGTTHTIEPFRASSDNRDQDMQQILFRTAEIYAPFDVQVRRAVGDGRYDARRQGNSTIFIGANTAKVDGTRGKFPNGYTPGKYSDYPGITRGDQHRPNSDPFDLGYVDPVGQRGKDRVNVMDIRSVAGAVAHEGGHTFGLVHTLTKPITDVMSYDAPNRFFANRTFAISDLNQEDKGLVHVPHVLPTWRGTRIVTQNAYTYLRAALGARPPDDGANVADPSAVDAAYQDGPLRSLSPGPVVQGALERFGDYDVFRVQQKEGQRLWIRVWPQGGERLVVVLMLFDFSGRQLLAFDTGRGRRSQSAQVVLPAQAGAYKLVVGAVDCASQGRYTVTVTAR
jgi:hypothetical protein